MRRWVAFGLAGLTVIAAIAGVVVWQSRRSSTPSAVTRGCLPPAVAANKGLWTHREAITVVNNSTSTLRDWPVAVRLSAVDFDFASAAPDGSDLRFTSANGHTVLPYWVQDYDPTTHSGTAWARVPSLPVGKTTIFLYSGNAQVPSASDGYGVFPIFTDGTDSCRWNTAGGVSVTATVGEFARVSDIRTIAANRCCYNQTPSLVEANDGGYLLAYASAVKGGQQIMLMRSTDQGSTWSSPVKLYNSSVPDPLLTKTPNGHILACFVKTQSQTRYRGFACMSSSDNGRTWSAPWFLADPAYRWYTSDQLVVVGTDLYSMSYGFASARASASVISGTAKVRLFEVDLRRSSDQGRTWQLVSRVVPPKAAGANEAGLVYLGGKNLLAVIRSVSEKDTYETVSHDLGQTWSPLVSIYDQVGVLQYPVIYHMGKTLMLLGREVLPEGPPEGNTKGVIKPVTRQMVAFFSTDGGATFGHPTLIENYVGSFDDGGYGTALVDGPSTALISYYALVSPRRSSGIRSALLELPASHPDGGELHVQTDFSRNLASLPATSRTKRYVLEFRARSVDTVSGNQFDLALVDGAGRPIVQWWTPHKIVEGWIPAKFPPADPSGDIEATSNGQAKSIFGAWQPGPYYTFTSVIDQSTQTQSSSAFDDTGNPIGTTLNGPLATPTTRPPAAIQVGSGTSLHDTNTYVSWIFIAPYTPTPLKVLATQTQTGSWTLPRATLR